MPDRASTDAQTLLQPAAHHDEAAAAEARRLVVLLDALPAPIPRLPGWESLAADGYEREARTVTRAVAEVRERLGLAAGAS